MKILVTGAKGFIGTNFVEMIHERHPEMVVVVIDKTTDVSNDHLLNKYDEDDWYLEYWGDICNINNEPQTFSNCDCIIHFAAESHVDRSCESIDPFIQSNIDGTSKMVEFAIKHNIPMINVSTDEVYGSVEENNNKPFTEHTPINPRNPYASSKASADMIVKSLGLLNPEWKYTTTRCGNNIGCYQDNTKLTPVIINSILSGDKIPVYGDGVFYRSWIDVRDHCDAIYLIMLQHLNDMPVDHNVYNIGSTNCISNIKLIEMICELMDVNVDDVVKFVSDPRGSCHDLKYELDSSLFRDEFNWDSLLSDDFKRVLMDTIVYYKDIYEQK